MTDVVIVGGGPAGATLGSYLGSWGIPCLIIERANHPRAHVGESLVPSTTRIFDEIGFLETMEREGFVKKYGAAWHPPGRARTVAIKFNEFPQEGVHQDYTYHVDRKRFDLHLLKHAETQGARVIQGVGVKRVLFDGDQATGVQVDLDGQSLDIPARVVVDASGRNTLLGSQLGYKLNDPLFNQFAVHAWFEGVDRGDAPHAEDIHIHFLPVERGWVWQIPITEEITSIGVVAERTVFLQAKQDVEAWFSEQVRSAPDIDKAMKSAKRITELTSEGDYSYMMERFAGPGFLLIGDAARFVDPIFSSGVSVALYSAKFAAETIRDALSAGDLSGARMGRYEERLKKGTTIWYEFIRLYYKLLPLFTKFIMSSAYRHQVLQLLQGDVYDRDEAPVLDAMRKQVEAVEAAGGAHLLSRALDESIPLD